MSTPDGDLRPSTRADSLRLATSELRWRCVPEELGFESTAELEPLNGIIGQDDAVEALRFGLEIDAPGQNIYVRGLTGTGRNYLLRRLLEEIRPACPLSGDYVYVTDFERTEEPRLLSLPRGHALAFRDKLDALVRFLGQSLPAALVTDELRMRRHFIDQRFEKEARALPKPLEDELAAEQLTLVSLKTPGGPRPAVLPLIEGEVATPEKIDELRKAEQLSDEDIEALEQRISAWAPKLEKLSLAMRDIGMRHGEALREFVQDSTRHLLGLETETLREQFTSAKVGQHLDALIEDVVRHGPEGLGAPEVARRYRVNVVLGHAADEDCPIIVENTPTLSNLLGTVDRRVVAEGVVVSDHLMIRPGAILRADGGYLVLEAREVLREPGAWSVLMRTLRSGELEIVPPELAGPWSTQRLKPEPIPVKVKVILIGDPGLYYALDAQDADFPNLFKVLADFDSTIELSPASVQAYAGLIARIARDEKLPDFGREAVAALTEHGARIAGRNDRLTTRFGRLSDIAREAAFITSKSTRSQVTAEEVREAIRRTKRRADLPARKFRERIADGTIHVQTQGRSVGQVNGLAVMSAGPLTYGFPARITATIGAGHSGAINIERESQLSGSIHTKGFHILRGLVRHLLQLEHPMAFSASIAFEQSYGGIDGDSASGAEICCLLSALTGVPLRQDLAMTGAIDQHGRIQPIGAATEKIEGFFDTCVDMGLTGTQGVILPRANVGDLMLREDVVAASADGRFHVYPVATIHEALEVFTGIEAGERQDGSSEYAEGTLLERATARAFEYWSFATAQPIFEEELPAEGEDTSATAAQES